MTKTQKYFHPLQSAKFREGYERIFGKKKRGAIINTICLASMSRVSNYYRRTINDAVDEEEYIQDKAARKAIFNEQ